MAIDVIDVVLMLAPLWGGHAGTQGFPTVFGGPQEAAWWHVCSAWILQYLAGNLIAHRLIWMGSGCGNVVGFVVKCIESQN